MKNLSKCTLFPRYFAEFNVQNNNISSFFRTPTAQPQKITSWRQWLVSSVLKFTDVFNVQGKVLYCWRLNILKILTLCLSFFNSHIVKIFKYARRQVNQKMLSSVVEGLTTTLSVSLFMSFLASHVLFGTYLKYLPSS